MFLTRVSYQIRKFQRGQEMRMRMRMMMTTTTTTTLKAKTDRATTALQLSKSVWEAKSTVILSSTLQRLNQTPTHTLEYSPSITTAAYLIPLIYRFNFQTKALTGDLNSKAKKTVSYRGLRRRSRSEWYRWIQVHHSGRGLPVMPVTNHVKNVRI